VRLNIALSNESRFFLPRWHLLLSLGAPIHESRNLLIRKRPRTATGDVELTDMPQASILWTTNCRLRA